MITKVMVDNEGMREKCDRAERPRKEGCYLGRCMERGTYTITHLSFCTVIAQHFCNELVHLLGTDIVGFIFLLLFT